MNSSLQWSCVWLLHLLGSGTIRPCWSFPQSCFHCCLNCLMKWWIISGQLGVDIGTQLLGLLSSGLAFAVLVIGFTQQSHNYLYVCISQKDCIIYSTGTSHTKTKIKANELFTGWQSLPFYLIFDNLVQPSSRQRRAVLKMHIKNRTLAEFPTKKHASPQISM